MVSQKKTASLEVSLKKLEDIVKNLESGGLSLDESIKSFEEGIKVYKDCKSALGKAEKKIKILTDGLKEEDFDL